MLIRTGEIGLLRITSDKRCRFRRSPALSVFKPVGRSGMVRQRGTHLAAKRHGGERLSVSAWSRKCSRHWSATVSLEKRKSTVEGSVGQACGSD